ncbi:hypothetical protein BDR03DRAFT_1087599 [Suillus americanus]|nr:hypothetical protein BDR03DRAFT_1087599 [Suillus americanus]
MHPALRILEVIDIISSHTEHGSLPALASTCRTFENPALNVLWRNLHSVGPLVKCLPSDLFGSDRGCLVLQRPPDGKVWDTLFKVLAHGFRTLTSGIEPADHFSFLRGISFDFAPHPESSASESAMLSQFFAILQEKCDNDKLKSFSFIRLGKKKSIELGIFTSLHAFSNLTQLVIEEGCDISMSDEELCQLVRAWPKLRVLKLSLYNIITLPTFHGLIGLLRLCPVLTSLSLDIDVTELDGIDLKCPGGGLCNKHIEFLALGTSHVRSPAKVAVILSGLFPRLEKVDLGGSTSDRWTLVNDFLSGFRLVREQHIEACVCSDL